MLSHPARAADSQTLARACAELRRRLEAGEDCRSEEYFSNYPELASDVDCALQIAMTEFRGRRDRGQSPSLAEWCRRFPHLQPQLERQLTDAAPPATLPEQSALTREYQPAGALPPGRRLGHYELL